jgi:hypothetical protein
MDGYNGLKGKGMFMKKSSNIVRLLKRAEKFNNQMDVSNNDMNNLISELTLLMNKYNAEIVPDEDTLLIRLLEKENRVVMEQMVKKIVKG